MKPTPAHNEIERLCSEAGLTSHLVIGQYEGARRQSLTRFPLPAAEATHPEAAGARWAVTCRTRALKPGRLEVDLEATVAEGAAREVAIGIALEDSAWQETNYVLVPGAVYAGNRFKSRRYAYSPPAVGPRPEDPDQTPWIGDLPRLERRGPSHLNQLSIDCAVPGLGCWFRQREKGLLLLTQQGNEHGPYGLEVTENARHDRAGLLLMSPGIRHWRAFTINGYTEPSLDRTATLQSGESIRLRFQLQVFACDSVKALFGRLFETRQALFPALPDLRPELPFSAAWDILHRKHNRENWREEMNLFQVNLLNDPPAPASLFQTGWCGGGITTLPMLQEGDQHSRERARRNIDFLFTGLSKGHLFHPIFDGEHWRGTLKRDPDATDPASPRREYPWLLSRRAADALYFLSRQCLLMRQDADLEAPRTEWIDGLRRNLEALKAIWKRHRSFGQYIHLDSGEITVSGSTSAALMPAAFIVAARLLDDPEALTMASEIGKAFREKDLADGITTGGPGDCVQAPDSESVAALIESFSLLYEATGRSEWLEAACAAVHQTASWALAYDYTFPEGTALARIRARTRGAYLANAQNKTGVPGICTLSGEGILRTFRASGQWAFLEWLRETTHTVPQYLGRPGKAIPTRLPWGRKGVETLPEGWICERINITHWGEAIGEQSAYSCWCECALMLVWCDLPGIYLDLDYHRLVCLDHYQATVRTDGPEPVLEIHNPTAFDGIVKVLAENKDQRSRPLPLNAGARFPRLSVPAGRTRSVPFAQLQPAFPSC